MNNKQPATDPITNKEDVQQSNDERIDEDFKNYPHHPAGNEDITPKTKEDSINAQVKKTDASVHSEGSNEDNTKKMKPHDEEETAHTGSTGKSFATTNFPGNEKDRHNIDEINSDGSGGAFNTTEEFADDDDVSRIDEK